MTVKYVNVAGAIIVRHKKDDEPRILLIRRAPTDHWPFHYEFPRGKCDKGKNENIIHCLKREVKEETSLDIEPVRYVGKFQYESNNGQKISTQYNFLCKMINPNQEVILSKEHGGINKDDKGIMWISTLGEAELLLMPEMKRIMSKVFDVGLSVYKNTSLTIEENIVSKYLSRIQ